jgi:hypothetical protein
MKNPINHLKPLQLQPSLVPSWTFLTPPSKLKVIDATSVDQKIGDGLILGWNKIESLDSGSTTTTYYYKILSDDSLGLTGIFWKVLSCAFWFVFSCCSKSAREEYSFCRRELREGKYAYNYSLSISETSIKPPNPNNSLDLSTKDTNNTPSPLPIQPPTKTNLKQTLPSLSSSPADQGPLNKISSNYFNSSYYDQSEDKFRQLMPIFLKDYISNSIINTTTKDVALIKEKLNEIFPNMKDEVRDSLANSFGKDSFKSYVNKLDLNNVFSEGFLKGLNCNVKQNFGKNSFDSFKQAILNRSLPIAQPQLEEAEQRAWAQLTESYKNLFEKKKKEFDKGENLKTNQEEIRQFYSDITFVASVLGPDKFKEDLEAMGEELKEWN